MKHVDRIHDGPCVGTSRLANDEGFREKNVQGFPPSSGLKHLMLHSREVLVSVCRCLTQNMERGGPPLFKTTCSGYSSCIGIAWVDLLCTAKPEGFFPVSRPAWPYSPLKLWEMELYTHIANPLSARGYFALC